MYDWLRLSRRVLLYTMQEKVKESCIKKPAQEEIEINYNAISALYPVLEGHKVWGAAEGLKLPIVATTSIRIEITMGGFTVTTSTLSLIVPPMALFALAA